MTSRLLFYSIAFFIVSMSSCSCDKTGDDHPQPNYFIPQGVKDYSLFKEGTYWIYRDSLSGIEDSIYVTSSFQGYDTLDDGNPYALPPGIYEAIETISHSDYSGYDYRDWCNSSWSGSNPTRTRIYREKSKPGDYVGETILIEYPFVIGNILYSHSGFVKTINYYSQFGIEGSNYDKVVKVYDSENITEGNSITNFYVASKIGIARKEIIDSIKVWNLVHYNIVQQP